MEPTNSNLPSVALDLDEKSHNVATHKPSVKLYATRVFQEATIGIISSIFTTHSKYRRLFKVFLSSLCIAGFIYHCVAFLNHVLGYPEVVDISSDRSKTYNWPAYTYCNNNPIRRSVFCSTYPQYCEKPSEAFCKKYSSYCGANATLIPIEQYQNDLPTEMRLEWILKLGSVPNVLKINESHMFGGGKNMEDEITGPYLRFAGTRRTVKVCYSVHSRVENNQQPLQKKRHLLGSTFIDELIQFYVDETEMINPRIEPGVYLSFHSPFEAVNPLGKGIFLKSGKTYRLDVEMQKEVLLKEPFESNCKDYDELWVKNNHTGPRTKKACQDKCWLDSDIFNNGCAFLGIVYPHKERLCENGTMTRMTRFPLQKCLESCRDECRSLKYTTEVSTQEFVEGVKRQEQHIYIDVKIFLSNEEVKVLRHSPKYETVDVISSIGGFMGCWLGVALLDILDVFGSITVVCRYAFRKRLKKENKKAAIHVI